MVNIFQIAVERLVDIGFYNFFLPFILFTTVLYAVLRKTQILGESPLIHGIVSVAAGLLIFGVPVIMGSSIVEPLTAFLTQSIIGILVFVIGFLFASFFVPNLKESLPEIFKRGGPANWIVWIILGIAAMLGLFKFIGKPIQSLLSGLKIPGEFLGVSAVLIITFIVFLIVAMGAGKEVK